MIRISEWLPNPLGSDADGEWLELWNSGAETVSLRGWRIENSSGKEFFFAPGELRSGGYAVFVRSSTKLTLKNENETLSLFDPSGRSAQISRFVGTAREGKSYNDDGNSAFFWARPTPGAANAVRETATIAHAVYPVGVPLNPSTIAPAVFLLALAVGGLLTYGILYASRKNQNLHKLLFGGDEAIR